MATCEFDENAKPLIKELGWKTVRELVKYDTAITMYKSMYNMATTCLSNIFRSLKDVHQIKLRDTSSNLRLHRVTTNMGLRSFSYQGAAVWKLRKDGYLTPVIQTLAKPSQKLNLQPFLTLLFIIFPFIYICKIVLGFTRRDEKRYLETDALPCLNKFKL